MHDLENLFEKNSVSIISALVEDKMPILNQLPEFKEKDKKFALAMEKFQNSLSKELSDEFDNVMRLSYQVDEYYLTLAYYLGKKVVTGYGSQ